MNRRISTFALLMALLTAGLGRADDTLATPAAPVISTNTSSNYSQVTCTSADDAACADALQMASDTREQLAPLLKLGPNWIFPVHIHILTPDDPLTAKINREAAAVFAQGVTMKIEAVVPSTDPRGREFVQRQFVTALLWEKFFSNTKTFDKNTKLDVVPVWLVEGLREWLNDDPDHNRESIVRRAVATDRAPALSDITGWREVSDDQLLGLWQRAFCYYLVSSLIEPGPHRDDFENWLASLSGPNPSSAALLFPTESAWQHELVEASARSRDIVFSWDDTEAALATAEVVALPATKTSKEITCSLDDVASLPHDKPLLDALNEKSLVLTALELRAHPAWHKTIELYRYALNALINDPNQAQAKTFLLQAQQRQIAEIAVHQKLVDYINWFEVTKDYQGEPSHFSSYFSTAQEMERVQADPAHPNPIRADLLQMESQL